MEDFLLAPPKDAIYEPGGIMNTLFVASRLGLESTVVGHVDLDEFGKFYLDCLEREGIQYVEGFNAKLGATSLCLVAVDPAQRHQFCSTFEVKPEPVVSSPANLTPSALQQMRQAQALAVNGYAFQEASCEILEHVFEEAISSDTITFFDPGPNGEKMAKGTRLERRGLLEVLRRSHVILATMEEAAVMTGESDPVLAARKWMGMKESVTKWVVIKLGPKGSLFFQRGVRDAQRTPGFQVDVSDTVGCGDSFAAAVAFGYLTKRGEKPTGVMELANAVGAITATAQGAGRNVADLGKVKNLLEAYLKAHSAKNGGAGVAAALEILESRKTRRPTSNAEPVSAA